MAQYFPELDPYFGCGEGPAIVRWTLNPKEILDLPFDEFTIIARPRTFGAAEAPDGRMPKKAASSIGCAAHPSIESEGGILVKEARRLQDLLRQTALNIREVCLRFPEYFYLLTIPGFGPDISAKVLRAIGDPCRFDNQRQVLKLTGLDISRGPERQEAGRRSRRLQEGEGRSSLRPLPGRLHRLHKEQAVHDLLHEQAQRQGA